MFHRRAGRGSAAASWSCASACRGTWWREPCGGRCRGQTGPAAGGIYSWGNIHPCCVLTCVLAVWMDTWASFRFAFRLANLDLTHWTNERWVLRSRDGWAPITAHLEVALGARHVQVGLGLQLAHARVLVGERAAVHLGRLQVARVQHLDWCVTIVISMDISIYIIGRTYLLLS